MSASQTPPVTLARTPLHALHARRGARMTPFAGYDMPVQYPMGVLKEHLHTRRASGLFDVSHMGQLVLRAKSGEPRDAALALERLVPADIVGLPQGRQRYALFTNETGGILDDLMVANLEDRLLLVVNAACKATDEAHVRAALGDVCDVERLDKALIALQGPASEDALAALAPICREMRFMDVRQTDVLGAPAVIVRSGYTGEDGFELSVPNNRAEEIAEALLVNPNVAPIGLGARDSLRLEAGLCLYGADIDTTTTPVEAGLTWAVAKARRAGGSRHGRYPGADIVDRQLAEGPPRLRVGLRPEGRAPVRAPTPLFDTDAGGKDIGTVTSGGFAPSLDAPVAMGYVPTHLAKSDTPLFAEVRGKRLPVRVAPLPFVPATFKR
jgi:aminomethyltransferase